MFTNRVAIFVRDPGWRTSGASWVTDTAGKLWASNEARVVIVYAMSGQAIFSSTL